MTAFIDQIDIGHGQSGKNFYYKTKHFVGPLQQLALQEKVSGDVELFYPDGPWPAPGGEELDVRAWGFGDFEHGLIKGLDISILKILDILDLYGPFSGVMGFSTGRLLPQLLLLYWSGTNGSRCSSGTHPRRQASASLQGFRQTH